MARRHIPRPAILLFLGSFIALAMAGFKKSLWLVVAALFAHGVPSAKNRSSTRSSVPMLSAVPPRRTRINSAAMLTAISAGVLQ